MGNRETLQRKLDTTSVTLLILGMIARATLLSIQSVTIAQRKIHRTTQTQTDQGLLIISKLWCGNRTSPQPLHIWQVARNYPISFVSIDTFKANKSWC